MLSGFHRQRDADDGFAACAVNDRQHALAIPFHARLRIDCSTQVNDRHSTRHGTGTRQRGLCGDAAEKAGECQ